MCDIKTLDKVIDNKDKKKYFLFFKFGLQLGKREIYCQRNKQEVAETVKETKEIVPKTENMNKEGVAKSGDETKEVVADTVDETEEEKADLCWSPKEITEI